VSGRRGAAALLLLLDLSGAAVPAAAELVPEAPVTVSTPADPEYRAALDRVYDGAFDDAERRLAALARAHPEDPVAPYLQALALEWRVEQAPSAETHDEEVLRLADEALARAAARLAADPSNGRALLARGAAHGIKSRLHLFRRQRRPATAEAVRMRESLLGARAAGVTAGDLDFGLGLYDYYADVLPAFFKIVRVLAGIPGGDRERGLDALARTARGGSLFHDAEARVQMFEIQSWFERRPDGAVHWIRRMWSEHRGWPLWGLKLCELLREGLGLFGESASVASEIVATAEEHRHPNYQPVVAAMGRVALGEALLADLRFAAAREAALPAEAGSASPAWIAPRAALVVARTLEIEGRREEAVVHYRKAVSGGDEGAARAARVALHRPLSPGQGRALVALAAARRHAEDGEVALSRACCLEALRAEPANAEARVCVAEERLDAGEPGAARGLVASVVASDDTTRWLRTRARLVLARALEQRGDDGDALRLYKEVWQNPSGRPASREAAAAGIGRLSPATVLPDAPRWDR
jgi:tetratricopeptide (TPR) repeat protein